MGLVFDLVERTVKNTGDAAITIKELVEKLTAIPPGDTVTLDPKTVAIEF